MTRTRSAATLLALGLTLAASLAVGPSATAGTPTPVPTKPPVPVAVLAADHPAKTPKVSPMPTRVKTAPPSTAVPNWLWDARFYNGTQPRHGWPAIGIGARLKVNAAYYVVIYPGHNSAEVQADTDQYLIGDNNWCIYEYEVRAANGGEIAYWGLSHIRTTPGWWDLDGWGDHDLAAAPKINGVCRP